MMTLINKIPITAVTVVHFFTVSNKLWCKQRFQLIKQFYFINTEYKAPMAV